MKLVWKALKDFEVSTTPTCGTHIHISPLVGSWDVHILAKLAKAIIFFDPAFETLFPITAARRQYALGNTHADAIAQVIATNNATPYATIFARIENHLLGAQGPNLQGFSDYLSPIRRFAWSFNRIGTGGDIEYRWPPGSRNAKDAINHIKFIRLFVEKVIDADDNDIIKWMGTGRPSVPYLGDFLGRKISRLFGNRRYWDEISLRRFWR